MLPGEVERDGRRDEGVCLVQGLLDVLVRLGAVAAYLDLALACEDRLGHGVGDQVGVEATCRRGVVQDVGRLLGV